MTRRKDNISSRRYEDNRSRYRGNKRRRKSKGALNIFFSFLMVIALGVLVFSLYQIGTTLLPYYQGRRLNQQLADQHTSIEVVENNNSNDVSLVSISDIDRIRFNVDFDSLLAINRDTVAWIRFIEPEIINYPVVRSHDNDEYLHTAFDGSFSRLGSIFLHMDNSTDFSDQHTIIFGHNMAVGGEMFSQLVEFMDQGFTEENPYFFIHTPDGVMRIYRIFMAAVVRADSPIYRMEFLDEADFLEYLDLSRSISRYTLDGDDLNGRSSIVTLSTCTNVDMADRFIIQGVLVEERIQ